MKFTFRRFAAAAILACSLVIAPVWINGCASKLESGGAYAPVVTNADNTVTAQAPDKEFFIADAAFYTAYSAIDAAFTFEKENRQALWNFSHNIKHQLDKLRPQAVVARNEYVSARKAYQANPTPDGLSTLQTVLGRIQQLQAAVTAALPK